MACRTSETPTRLSSTVRPKPMTTKTRTITGCRSTLRKFPIDGGTHPRPNSEMTASLRVWRRSACPFKEPEKTECCRPLKRGAHMILPVFHLKRVLPENWQARLRFISRRLPRRWFYLTNDRRLWRFTGEAELMRQRPNLVRYDLQPGCFLETYLIDQINTEGNRYFGPAACLVVHGFEILRFDCVGHPLGHYHAMKPYPE